MRIPVFEPWLDESDIESVTACLRNGWISGTSPVISDFEAELTQLSQRKYVTAVANGSIALDLAFSALDLKPGDEVIVPNFTIISCLAAIHRTGATAVLVDCDPYTWNVTTEYVERAITEKTKVVLIVHLYGLPAPIADIEELCKKRGIILVEDAAEAHGQTINGRACGSFGDISIFSFYANKHLTTGEGGAVCTNSPTIAERIKSLRNLSFGKVNRFEHEEFGWNYRMSGLAAALGLSQIKKIDHIISMKKIQGERYRDLLQTSREYLRLPEQTYQMSLNHYWVFGIVAMEHGLSTHIVKSLEQQEIETRPFFWALSLQPVIKKTNFRISGDLDNSENLSHNGFYIPTGAHISAPIQESIVGVIEDSIRQFLKRSN